MHDCRQTEEQLMDLVFEEPDEAPRLRAEIESCSRCREQYRSLQATLSAFDQVIVTTLPDESYWPGYEAKLRTKLAEAEPANAWERWRAALIGCWSTPGLPVAVIAGLILLMVATVIWFSSQPQDDEKPMVADRKPSPSASVPDPVIRKEPQQPEPKPEQQVIVKATPRPAPRERRRAIQRETDKLLQARFDPAPARPHVAVPPVRPDETFAPARHFEKAQMLLRSFRNARIDRNDRKGARFDLAYEKRQSRQLVFDNILLRRAAAAKGNLPVEEVLSSLEPLLLDIANLPTRPSADEVQVIRERMQKKEIVASLQLYSASAAKPGISESLNP